MGTRAHCAWGFIAGEWWVMQYMQQGVVAVLDHLGQWHGMLGFNLRWRVVLHPTQWRGGQLARLAAVVTGSV